MRRGELVPDEIVLDMVGEQQRAVLQRRIAIAQLAGVFDFDRNAGQLFQEIFADQGRVPACAAGGENDAINAAAKQSPAPTGFSTRRA